MNITSYVAKFGNLSFKERPFTDVDALILAELAYLNLHLYGPCFLPGDRPRKLKNLRISDYKALTKDSAVGNKDIQMFKLLEKSKRFRDIEVLNTYEQFSKEDIVQFYACTFRLPTDELYLAFRGTDVTILGWKEDLLLGLKGLMPSYFLAIRFLNTVLKRYPEQRIYIGGHSKGGHLAFYAACHLKPDDAKRLNYVYSFDGPGFKNPIDRFPSYELVKDKLLKYLTLNDMIGLFYEDVETYKVVYSNGLLFGGHEPYGWKINAKTGELITADAVSRNARRNASNFLRWVNELSFKERQLTFNAIQKICETTETVYDLLFKLPELISRRNRLLVDYSDEDQKTIKKVVKKLQTALSNTPNPNEEKK